MKLSGLQVIKSQKLTKKHGTHHLRQLMTLLWTRVPKYVVSENQRLIQGQMYNNKNRSLLYRPNLNQTSSWKWCRSWARYLHKHNNNWGHRCVILCNKWTHHKTQWCRNRCRFSKRCKKYRITCFSHKNPSRTRKLLVSPSLSLPQQCLNFRTLISQLSKLKWKIKSKPQWKEPGRVQGLQMSSNTGKC